MKVGRSLTEYCFYVCEFQENTRTVNLKFRECFCHSGDVNIDNFLMYEIM